MNSNKAFMKLPGTILVPQAGDILTKNCFADNKVFAAAEHYLQYWLGEKASTGCAGEVMGFIVKESKPLLKAVAAEMFNDLPHEHLSWFARRQSFACGLSKANKSFSPWQVSILISQHENGGCPRFLTENNVNHFLVCGEKGAIVLISARRNSKNLWRIQPKMLDWRLDFEIGDCFFWKHPYQ